MEVGGGRITKSAQVEPGPGWGQRGGVRMLAAGRVEAGTAGDGFGGGTRFSPADHRFIQHLLHTCHHAGHVDGRQEERALPDAGNTVGTLSCGDTGRNRKEVRELVGRHGRPLGASALPRFVGSTSRAPRARAHPLARPTPSAGLPSPHALSPLGTSASPVRGVSTRRSSRFTPPRLGLRSEPTHKPGEAGAPHTSSQKPSTAVVPEDTALRVKCG